MAFQTCADSAFAHRVLHHTNLLPGWPTLCWAAASLIFAFAAWQSTAAPPNEHRSRYALPAAGAIRANGLSFFVAFGCMALAWLTFIAFHIEVITAFGGAALLGMLVAVFLRQLMGQRDNSRLNARLQESHREMEQRVHERTVDLKQAIAILESEIGERTVAEVRLQRQLKELAVLSTVAGLAIEAKTEEELVAKATAAIRDHLYPDNVGILFLDGETGILKHSPSYHTHDPSVVTEDVPPGKGIVGRVVETGQPVLVADVTKDPGYLAMDGTMRSEIAVPMRSARGILGVLDAESGEENAFTEADLRVLTTLASQISTALEHLRSSVHLSESEERFRCLSDAAFEGIAISENGWILDVNERLASLMGYEVREMAGRKIKDFVAPEAFDHLKATPKSERDNPLEHEAVRKDQTKFLVESQGRDIPYHGRNVRVSTIRDITERKRSEVRIQLQIKRLASLREIDAAINSTLDLDLMLGIFLEHAVAQLGVDAADILLSDTGSGLLLFARGQGMRSMVPPPQPVLGTFAGAVASAQKTVIVPDTAEADSGVFLPPQIRDGFRACFAASLVVKGQSIGVLEAFSEKPFRPDSEWVDFLETLAGQAALAVENRSLFDSIKRSHRDLASAYDTTLEGWSRALELRDRETQGHTRRVADTAVLLARAAGIPEEDLVQVRRGALLHDIGKMGIPDSILLKPGPLESGEWEIMRRHTTYAFELLSPITFLGSAIDIPLCHHERWDGTGYPRGLRGERIPIAARVFSVVDSWDALRFDRPYRAAWPTQKVRDYLREKSGTHFDPRLVDLFLNLRV